MRVGGGHVAACKGDEGVDAVRSIVLAAYKKFTSDPFDDQAAALDGQQEFQNANCAFVK